VAWRAHLAWRRQLSVTDKYRHQAEDWSKTAYADPARYLAHRAELVRTLGPRLEPGETVLDLACGDAGLAAFLPDQRYLGVDASPEMVAAAAGRAVLGDLNEYEPDEPVAATCCFRAIYYAHDRRAFFERVASYTERKLVFDLNPRQYRLAPVRADLEAAGWDRLALRPFLVPQTAALPGPLYALAIAAERTPLASLLLRVRFTYLCAAFRGTNRYVGTAPSSRRSDE
jgi:SAM-dependent methyltransferase